MKKLESHKRRENHVVTVVNFENEKEGKEVAKEMQKAIQTMNRLKEYTKETGKMCSYEIYY